MLAHSSVRARRSLFGPGISPCLSETTMRALSVPKSFRSLQGFGAFLARLDAQRVPVWTPHRRKACYEEVSPSGGVRTPRSAGVAHLGRATGSGASLGGACAAWTGPPLCPAEAREPG